MADRKQLLLNEKNIYKAFIILAIPVFLSNMVRSLHDFVDTYFIGQIEDSVSSQAGIAVAWPLMNLYLAFSIGLGVAGVAIIGQFLGNKNQEKAQEYSQLLLFVSIIIGVILNILSYFLSPHIVYLLNARGATLSAASSYLQIRSFELVFVFIFASYQASRQAQGDTLSPVILALTGFIVNIILTYVFVDKCDLGVCGAAIATVIGQAIICPVCLFKIFSKNNILRFDYKKFVFIKDSFIKLIKVALPSASSQALACLGFLVLQALILSYGDETSAAFSIGNKTSNLLLMPIMALGTVLAAFLSQNIGAGNKERARQAYRVSRNLGFIISFSITPIILIFREPILSLLTNSNEVLSISVEYLFWLLLTMPFMMLFQNYLSTFNGSGNTKFSLLLTSTRLWLMRLPMILIFKYCLHMDRSGIWTAMVISNIVICFIGTFIYRKLDFEPKIIKEKNFA